MEQTIKLPASVGDYVFVIRDYYKPKSDWRWGSAYMPSVVKAVITEIGCDKRGWYIITQDVGRYGSGTRIKLEKCGINWFTSEAEAQAKLTELLNK